MLQTLLLIIRVITERGTTAADSDGSASVKKITLRLAAYGPIERLILSDDGAKPLKKIL